MAVERVNQGRLDPWSLNAINPWIHWSQVIKGTTTGANWLRVVTPYPLGTQSGPLRLPYGCLMPPLCPPYGCLLVALRPPYAPLMVPFRPPVAQTSPGQGTILIDFSMVFIGFQLLFKDFH